MIARFLTAAAALAAISAMPAQAQAVIKQYKAKEVVSVAPGQAYILYRAPNRFDIRLLRTPDPEQLAEYKAARAAALVKAQAKYVKAKASYEREMKSYEAYKKMGQPVQRPMRPIEPTETNFDYPAIELSNFLNVMGGRVLTKDDGYSYLIAVPPGTYTIYGQLLLGGNGMIGVCMCMGSVKFEAKGGTVTDIGEIRFDGPASAQGAIVEQVVVPASDAMPLPPQVKGLPIERASLRAAGKMPNYFGVLVERVQPIRGVLAYERDKVIDVKAGTAVAAPGAGN